jgi:hypothetical protein
MAVEMITFPLPFNYFDGGRRLTNQDTDDLADILNLLAATLGGVAEDGGLTSAPTSKVWPFQTNETTQYAGGFYEFAATDNDFSPSIMFGDAGVGVAAHFLVVLGAVTVDTLTIRVSGTSITDAGVQTVSDSEDIVIPADTAVDSYFETAKKWNGEVTVEAVSGTAVTANYGWSKYHDFGNTNFRVTGLEALWESDSTDSDSDIVLIHHKADGWTFNSGTEPTPPAPIASRSTDHAGQDTHRVGPGAWKRADLEVDIGGADSEGILFCVTSGSLGVGTLSFRTMSLEVEFVRVAT